jgi:4-diphosphocytidyl-2-C-methyl-D-erythritol kinase
VSAPLSTTAHAKVNLTLEVLGKRKDGYHEVTTLFDELELHDDLSLEPGAVDDLEVEGESSDVLPCDASNLVLQAAAEFRRTIDPRGGGRFRLLKRIPSGAGLGGGSSDAAAALRLMARANGVEAADPRLVNAAKRLGADVPFFLTGGRAWAGGRGDEIHPLPGGPRLHYVLLWPGYGCSTAEVFSRWQRALPGTDRPVDSRAGAASWEAFLAGLVLGDSPDALAQGLFNDLEASALETCQPLADMWRCLVEAGFTVVHLSGSGSTLFIAGGSHPYIAAVARTWSDLVATLRARGSPAVAPDARVICTRSR